MDFHVTPEMAADREHQVRLAGEALGLDGSFSDASGYEPGGREDFGRYLEAHSIRYFSVEEATRPANPAIAGQFGFEHFTPPRHLWPWSLIVLKLGDLMREDVGAPIRLRNLYRPQPYNERIADSAIDSDHPNAAAGDFDFASVGQRRQAEALMRRVAAETPSLEISMGLGAKTLHVGALSPKGSRHWFYDNYEDERVPLVVRAGSSPNPPPEEPDEGTPTTPGRSPDDQDAEPGVDLGTETDEPVGGGVSPPSPASSVPLTRDVLQRLVSKTAGHESGGRFDAMNLDGEFEGRFGEDHAAFQTYHVGLSFGIVQFTQDSGTLGMLLSDMQRHDGAAFARIFGEAASELLDVTTAEGATSSETPPRGARVRPVAGHDLWEEPWVGRFRNAGAHADFQGLQTDLAARIYLEPMLRFCAWLGLDTDRALSIVFDRAVQFGVGGARRWIMSVVGPISSEDDLGPVLTSYGFASLRDFQTSMPGLTVDGKWGPNSHAAICGFERSRTGEDAFVLHVPERTAMLEMLQLAARDKPWGHRLEKIMSSTSLDDRRLELLAGGAT